MRTLLWGSIGCLLLLVGCGEGAVEGEDGIEQSDESVLRTNGIKLNGIKLNGIKLNGIKLNGIKLNGTTLVGGVKLSGSQIVYTKSTGTLAGVTAGSTLVGALANYTTVTLKIASVWPSGDRYGYSIYYGGTPLCGFKSPGVPYLAYPLAGRWDESAGTSTGGDWIADSTTFTFACQNAALGKCVEWGYKPWVSTTLRVLHQTCTRLVRGDYCGNGTPYTIEGSPVDIYDRLGIQTNSSAPGYWEVEAQWGPNGAICVSLGFDYRGFNPQTRITPPCWNALRNLDCDDGQWLRGAFLMSEDIDQD